MVSVTTLKVLKLFTCAQQGKNAAIYSGLFCEDWCLLTSHWFREFARTFGLAKLKQPAQLLVKSASPFKSLQGFTTYDATVFAL